MWMPFATWPIPSVDGVTKIRRSSQKGRDFVEVVEISEIVDGPISAEVTATAYDEMVAEGRKLANTKISR